MNLEMKWWAEYNMNCRGYTSILEVNVAVKWKITGKVMKIRNPKNGKLKKRSYTS